MILESVHARGDSRLMNNLGAGILVSLAVMAFIAAAVIWLTIASDCAAKHGVLVRGVVFYVCIEEGKH